MRTCGQMTDMSWPVQVLLCTAKYSTEHMLHVFNVCGSSRPTRRYFLFNIINIEFFFSFYIGLLCVAICLRCPKIASFKISN